MQENNVYLLCFCCRMISILALKGSHKKGVTFLNAPVFKFYLIENAQFYHKMRQKSVAREILHFISISKPHEGK